MKKILLMSCMLLTVLSTVACGDSKNEPFASGRPESSGQPITPEESEDQPDTPMAGGSERYLVLYCSRTSNTERVAQQIQATLGCDMAEVEPQTPYDNDYNAMLSRAQEELAAIREGHYPAVKTSVESFDDYDVLFIGYPIWYGSMATPMQSFLHQFASELAGKRIALFATSGSSGIASSVGEAQSLCSQASVLNQTLLLTSSMLSQMENRVAAWLEALGVNGKDPDEMSGNSSLNMNITVGNRTLIATMEDNASGRDFLSRLPLEAVLNDYQSAEKIFYPDPELITVGVTRGCAPVPGDITIYAPGGNVAIFYKNGSYSNHLIKIGHIEDVEALSVPGNVSVKFEKPVTSSIGYIQR